MPVTRFLPLFCRSCVAAATCCLVGSTWAGPVHGHGVWMASWADWPAQAAAVAPRAATRPGPGAALPAAQVAQLAQVAQVTPLAAANAQVPSGVLAQPVQLALAGPELWHRPESAGRPGTAPTHSVAAHSSAYPAGAEGVEQDINSYPALALGALAALALVARRRISR